MVMEEPSTTGSGALGVMNGAGKAGGGEGAEGREVMRSQLKTCHIYQSILDW